MGAWVFNKGSAGPIFNFNRRGPGVRLWFVARNTLLVGLLVRGGRRFTRRLATSKGLVAGWNFVAATYRRRTGVARLFVNNKFVGRKYIGRIRLATNVPVRLGALKGDRRYFRGMISCAQFFSKALSARQLRYQSKKCFRGRGPVPVSQRFTIRQLGCYRASRRILKRIKIADLRRYGKRAIRICAALAYRRRRMNFGLMSRGICLATNRKSLLKTSGRINGCRFGLGGPRLINIYSVTKRPVRPIRPHPGGRVFRKKLDLALLIDGSGSIQSGSKGNFKNLLNFAKSLVRSFEVSRHYTRVGIVLYSSKVHGVYPFGRYRSGRSVVKAINRLRYPRGGTRTGAALSYTLKTLFARDYRKVPKAVVVLTDGKSEDNVSGPANNLRRAGVEIFAIGFGRRCKISQLRSMASRNKPRHTFIVSFRNWRSIVRIVKIRLSQVRRRVRSRWHYRWIGCYKVRRVAGRIIANFRGNKYPVRKCAFKAFRYGYRGFAVQNGGLCIARRRWYLSKYHRATNCLRGKGAPSAIDVYFIRKGPYRPRPVPPPRPRPRPVCVKRLDLVILLDGSSSIEHHRKGSFQRCLNFVKKLISSFYVHRGFVRVAVILFNRKPYVMFNLNKHRNTYSAIRNINTIRYPRGGTKTGRALSAAAHLFIRPRPRSAQRVLLVITNGRSEDNVKAPAKYLKRNLGVRIIALGIGPKTSTYYLRQLASSRSHVFKIRGFRNLHSVVNQVKKKACGKRGRYFNRYRHLARRKGRKPADQHTNLSDQPQADPVSVSTSDEVKTQDILEQPQADRISISTSSEANMQDQVNQPQADLMTVSANDKTKTQRMSLEESHSNIKENRNQSASVRDFDPEPANDGTELFGIDTPGIERSRIVPNGYATADYYWPFDVSVKGESPDLVHRQMAKFNNGSIIQNSQGRGAFADSSKSGSWISLGDFKGKCFSDPGTCKHEGLTISTWINIDKNSLNDKFSSYIFSSGGQSTKARGFALLHLKNQFILILSIKDKQWKLEVPALPDDWFNLAFTWENNGLLKLFINGQPIPSPQPIPVSRPKDTFTEFVLGRPNNSFKPEYKMSFKIDNLALWERALSEKELKSLFNEASIISRKMTTKNDKAKQKLNPKF